ncbi:MAG: hypothetical protein JWQ35_1830 [Bacteriovoracaceae bacterium]|nr:hypothetical protein [Bacteriovoracaceae bacterium]
MNSIHGLPNIQNRAADILSNKSLFTNLDKNHDHSLNQAEFTAFANTLGINGEELFKKLDTHKTGKISFNQFEQGLTEVKKALFKKLDSNNDGVIDVKEIENFAKEFHFDPKKLMAALQNTKTKKISMNDFVSNFQKILSQPGKFSILNTTTKPTTADEKAKMKAAVMANAQPIDSSSIFSTVTQSNKLDIFG